MKSTMSSQNVLVLNATPCLMVMMMTDIKQPCKQ